MLPIAALSGLAMPQATIFKATRRAGCEIEIPPNDAGWSPPASSPTAHRDIRSDDPVVSVVSLLELLISGNPGLLAAAAALHLNND